LLVPAFIISAVGSSFISPSYQYIIRVVTSKENRSTSIALINTLANIVSMIVPPLAAFLIMYFGGIRLVKYTFFIAFLLIFTASIYVAKTLKIPEYVENEPKKGFLEPLKDLVKVYKISRERKLHYWLIFVIIGPFVNTIVSPFWTLYAYEVCETPGELIGFLPTAQSLTYILLLIPVSRLSDKIGRKKVFLILQPFLWLSFLTLVFAGTFKTEYSYLAPLLSWAFYGVFAASSPSMLASIIEAFPKEYVSRWTSLRNVLYYIVAIFAGFLGGVLWSIDPRIPFTVAFLSDAARTLLLFKVPETNLKTPSEEKETPQRILIYELPGAGLGTVTKLLKNRLNPRLIDVVPREIDEKIKLAKEARDTLIVLLVAPRHERALKLMKEKGEPFFVAYKEIEEEDKKVSKVVKKYFKADLEKLPPFDIAINTQRIPPEVAEKIIEIAYNGAKKKKKSKT
ncbi:MAG TPA: MFS transporter, partial [Thermoproteales archaeon]|nr:MFS transporter [Thermoproteales archaeon]